MLTYYFYMPVCEKKTSVIFICKLDIIRKEYVIWLQIFSAAVLPNIIKIGPQLTK